jgi:alkanesulfonate monooxygenase SsuD/methylene tetrahydromethanopterin reductase-like flavin-dependent oxidoreductase (luciferase family)
VAASFRPSRSRFGVVLPQGWRQDLDHLGDPSAQFEAMLTVAREADVLGFDSVWLYDHLQPPPTFECWTSLAAIARETEHVRLGQIVTCNLYRNPALLARMALTLDALSQGRALIGLGAGWDEQEYRDHGYAEPWPSTGERLRRLDEGAATVRRLAPHIPLLIGGQGERVLLRLVAKHADACNLTDTTDPAWYRQKLDVLARHCEDLGRDPDEILKTAAFNAPAQDAAETLAAIREAGIDYFILYFGSPENLDALRVFAAEVMPRLL